MARIGNLSVVHFGISIQCTSTSFGLMRAILDKDVRGLKDGIDTEGANVNELYRCWANDQYALSLSYTPVSLAVSFSTNRVVKSLLRRGADPNVKCDMTPLGVAVQKNSKKLVALLLDSGADVNLLTHPVVKWKSSDDDKETRDSLMQTPLHIACRKGLVAMTTYLLLKQAAVDIIDGSGSTPIDAARKHGHREVEGLLRDAVYRSSMSVHPSSCRDENVPIRIGTHRERTRPITTQLIMACAHNDTKQASYFIAYGANVNATDAFLDTALHYACANGNRKLVELLLKSNANADALNLEKQSPIQVALKYGYLEISFILIEHKCVLPDELLFVTYSGGNSLLHIACKHDRISVVKQLIKRGAFLNVVNRKGKSPIHYVWQSGSIQLKRTVVDYIFQYYKTDGRRQRIDECAEWVKRRVEMESWMLIKVISQDCRGSLAVDGEEVHENLCSACCKLTPDACHFLLSRGICDLSMLLASCCSRPCEANCTSLLHLVCCKISAERNMVGQLIEHGADVNAVDCHGNTPLHLACWYGSGRWSVINPLLRNGASPYIVNGDGKTALWCAFWKNNSKLVRWLISEKRIDVDAEVLHGFNDKENTLLLMLANGEADDELLWRLVERSARINVPPRATSESSQGASVPCRKQPRLLDVLAKSNNGRLIRKLVEVGCCDFTADMFRSLLQRPRWSPSNERSMCSRVQMWRWFLLAGFGQCREVMHDTDKFVQEFYLQEFSSEWKSVYDSEMPAYNEDANSDEDDDDVNIFHTHLVSATTNATRVALRWLQHATENPTSLSRLCVYTIRHQLIYADPDGKSIFSSIDKLPLPTRLKDSLKLRDIECEDECFNQKPSDSDRSWPFPFGLNIATNSFYITRPSLVLFDYSPPESPVLIRTIDFLSSSYYSHPRTLVNFKEEELITYRGKKEQLSLEKTSRSIQYPYKRNKNVERKPLSYSVRRSSTLVQPRRRR